MIQRDPAEEPPPLAASWGRLYSAVACYLAALIALFWLFTRTYSR